MGIDGLVGLFGVVAATGLEDVLRNVGAGDFSQSPEAMLELQEHLTAKGFTAAPNSTELVSIVHRISEQDIDILRRTPMPPGIQSWHLVKACITQLSQMLPSTCVTLGLYKARARTCREDNASRLHKDDVLLTEADVTKALFPSQACMQAFATPFDDEQMFARYTDFCADARQTHPSLELPSCPATRGADLSGVTRELISSVRRYNEKQTAREDELIFDNVNVWIPRDTKQLIMLPLVYSCELQWYPLCPDHVERVKTSFAGKFEALPKGAALIFYGQSLLHQALTGQGFDCGSGSVEGRYLVLTTRRHAHSGSLRDHLGLTIATDAGSDSESWE
jgi:hypothetical protein